MNPADRPLLCLAGPTASGKSKASMAIADLLPIEIVNVDSATIYQGMDIGTAKPDANDRARVPHHLLDIIDPAQAYSAAQFLTDAKRCITDIQARGKTPLLVGGTMLYFKVLQDGIDDLPGASAAIRAGIQDQAQSNGWPAMHAELAKIDPVTAERLPPNDRQRIGRALEIYHSTGRPMSSFFDPNRASGRKLQLISLEPSDRQVLHQRIGDRFDLMLEQGLVDEVQALMARSDLHDDLPSIRCVGYRQIWAHLQGQDSLAQAREKAIAATRQLAKRQLTWLRGMKDRHVIDSLAPNAIDQVCHQVSPQVKSLSHTQT